MKMSFIALHSPHLHSSRVSLLPYVKLAQGLEDLSIVIPTGSRKNITKLGLTSLFFHNGLIGNMVNDDSFSCREALVNELRRNSGLGQSLGLQTITIVKLSGILPEYVKPEELIKFIQSFVEKREGRPAYMRPLTTVNSKNKIWTITFPISNRYTDDAYSSASMLVWLLRNCSLIFDSEHNFENLEKIVERLAKLETSISRPSTYQSLIFWLALYTISKSGRVTLSTQAQIDFNRGPNGPVNYIDSMDFKQTMTNVLFIDNGIDKLHKLTDGFSDRVLGKVRHYYSIKRYTKYLKPVKE